MIGILALIAEFENNIRPERQMEALSDKSKRTCEGCWSETFRPSVDDTWPARQCDSVRPKALRKTTWDISSDISQANSGMASGSPNHHLDWLVYCVGDRPGTPPLASNRELIGVNSRWLRGLDLLKNVPSGCCVDRPRLVAGAGFAQERTKWMLRRSA